MVVDFFELAKDIKNYFWDRNFLLYILVSIFKCMGYYVQGCGF